MKGDSRWLKSRLTSLPGETWVKIRVLKIQEKEWL